jgi:hypothetical protein
MKKLLFLLLIGYSTLAFGQQADMPDFDMEEFDKKSEIAEWLFEYDMVAWVTTDSVMASDKKEIEKLGAEWFCYIEDYSWHAVYGDFENNDYEVVFHYLVEDYGEVERTDESIDTSILNRYSRALQTAKKQFSTSIDTLNLGYNQYILENEDNTLSVYILPAFQTNNVAVYGKEFIYTIDESGNNILKDDSYTQNQYSGFEIDETKEIWLDYSELEKPTIGALFFAWYYKSYFAKIVISTSKSTTTTMKVEDGWTWVNAVK